MATAQPDDAKTDKLVDGKSADKKPAPDGTVMMALGKYRFAVGTAQYAALQRHTEFRWKEVERVGRMPSQQFVGPGTESIEIEGTIYPHHAGGLKQIEAMRAEARRGEPLDLVGGYGEAFGLWVVTSIQETASHFLAGGAPLRQGFRLALKTYGADTIGEGGK